MKLKIGAAFIAQSHRAMSGKEEASASPPRASAPPQVVHKIAHNKPAQMRQERLQNSLIKPYFGLEHHFQVGDSQFS
jgi:hypothetical protein